MPPLPPHLTASGQGEPPVIVITGGASGIGEAVAYAFAARRAQIVLVDIDSVKAEAVAAQVRAIGGAARAAEADVRRSEVLEGVAAAVEADFGRIDVLVACAGISDQGPVELADPERQRSIVEINLLGSIYAVRAVLPGMRARDRGHIVLVASVSGREWHTGEAVYIASKWGQVGFGHALRQDLLGTGIRVTLIEPGMVDTPLTRNSPQVAPLLAETRALRPDEVASAVLFACSQPDDVLVSELTVRPVRQAPPRFAADPSHGGDSPKDR